MGIDRLRWEIIKQRQHQAVLEEFGEEAAALCEESKYGDAYVTKQPGDAWLQVDLKSEFQKLGSGETYQWPFVDYHERGSVKSTTYVLKEFLDGA